MKIGDKVLIRELIHESVREFHKLPTTELWHEGTITEIHNWGIVTAHRRNYKEYLRFEIQGYMRTFEKTWTKHFYYPYGLINIKPIEYDT